MISPQSKLSQILLLAAFAFPIQNNTSVEIVSTDTNDRGVVLHLKNTAPLSILGITVSRDHEEEDLALQPTQRIAPGALFDFSFPATASELEESKPVIIRAVLFADLTWSGDESLAQVMTQRLAGAQQASRQVLAAIRGAELSEDSMETLAVPGGLSVRAAHAYKSGYLGVQERGHRDLKRLKDRKTLGGTDVSDYYKNLLEVAK